MIKPLKHIRTALIAIVALALSAGLAFGANPPEAASPGLANAASHAGKTVPVRTGWGEDSTDGEEDGDEELGEEEGTTDEESTEEDESTTEEESTEEDEEGVEEDEEGDNCSTDPTTLTPEELAAMNHGAMVCWAAHQTVWPEEFRNHGAWVSSWAHWSEETSETEDELTATSTKAKGHGHGQGNGQGKGKGKGHLKQR